MRNINCKECIKLTSGDCGNHNVKQIDTLSKEDLINYIKYLEDTNWDFMENKVLEAEMLWSKLLDKNNKKLAKYRKEVFEFRKKLKLLKLTKPSQL